MSNLLLLNRKIGLVRKWLVKLVVETSLTYYFLCARRFIHPGVMDKGNYSMFDTVRPIVTPGGPPPPNASGPMVYPMFMPHMAHPHLPGERGVWFLNFRSK